MPLEPGTLVGPYKIVSLIGTGGMGEVYQARDTRLGREVALKVLPPERVAEPERRQRFLQEAQAASILSHPSIVAIYDIGSQDGFDFIAMEFVDGHTLDHLIPKGGMRVEQALGIAIPVADALVRAHAAGIVHRDLKPGNVMVARDGRVKLVDFGLAKLGLRLGSGDDDSTRTALSSGTHTVEGRILGTVSYMSPEQAEGKKVDARSDIFSFGTLLYEMLTGERAFRGDSTLSTLSAILTLEPRPLRSIAPAIPPEIERVITRCIKKDPDKRWQNMTDIRVALAELKEETESGTLTAQERPRAAAAGGGTKWPLVAGALAGLALVLAGAFWLTQHAEPGKPTAATVTDEAPAGTAGAPAAARDAGSFTVPGAATEVTPGAGTGSGGETGRRAGEGGVPAAAAAVAAPPPGSAGPAAGVAPPKAPPKPRERAPATPAAPPRPAAAASPPSPPTPEPARVALPEGARILVALASEVRSSAVKQGDRVSLFVAEDALIEGRVVVRKGTPATGEILDVQRRNVFGGGGRLVMTVLWTTAVDGQEVRLRPVPTRAGGKKAEGISLLPGKSEKAGRGEDKREIVAPAGASYNAWVDSSKEIAASR